MLIVVNSMPKVGSTWFHNCVVRCLSRLGHPTLQAALAQWPVTVNHRGNPGGLDGKVLTTLLAAAERQTFAVKAHVPPNQDLVAAIEQGRARMVFILRHPAAICRSALAYGAFCREHGWDEPYRDLFAPEDAARFVAPSIAWAEAWLQVQPRATARYETLFASEAALRCVIHRLAPEAQPVSAAFVEEMRPDRLSQGERDWLRVNRVRRPELSPAVARLCRRWAERLGYGDDAGTPP